MAAGVLLDDVLGHLAAGTSESIRDACLTAAEEVGPAALGMAALVDFWLGDFAAGTRHARAGLARAGDDDRTRALCLATASLAAAGDLDAEAVDEDELRVLLAGADEPSSRWWSAVRYIASEAALVGARIGTAATLDATGPPAGAAWTGHPFAPVMWICQARIAAFSGRIDPARAILPSVRTTVVADSRLASVTEAVTVLIEGNAGDADGIRIAADIAAQVPDQPRDFIDRGALLLLAFGAIAVYDVRTAAGLAFRAGADAALSHCTLIDRALCFEMFLNAALLEDDAGAVGAWLEALSALSAHPVTAPSVDRARARVAIAAGDADGAIELLVPSIEACLADDRAVEAAEGTILLGRARILAQDLRTASRELRALVADSDRTGFGAVRRAASATLASSGRRLPPVAGAGWDALSEREAEVARAVLVGQEVEEIAAALFLAPSTVRTHVSRVLCAFGVATRIGLLAAVGGSSAAPSVAPPNLSPRQSEVAALVAAGRTNPQIAEALGISVKGVEKHVGDVLARWDAGSRFELARTWWTGRAADG